MASNAPAAQKWKYAQQIEQKLQTLIQEDRPTYTEFDQLVHEMRVACEQTILLDIEYASGVAVGKHLWDVITMINVRYRKLLDRFRKGENKKLVVERRKTEKHYVDFLKTTSVFYKGYIQRIASQYGGIPELRRIANSLELSTLSLSEPKRVTPKIESLVKLTCHATLWRLGDLSRYRNQIRTNNRSWEPALALYQLANDLHPASGYGHNQMAVIALAEENHLHAVYHIFRAITAEQPHPLAKGNLDVEFKKIIAGWDKRRLGPKQDSLSNLVWWFCLLHAHFHAGVDFKTHDELENEVLSRMALLLKEQSFPEILEKFVLISFAAEFYAGMRVREEAADERANKSYFFCLEFNVRMMFALLQVLLPELDEHLSGEDLPNGQQQPRERISAIARRVLPSIRQYGVWLASSAQILLAGLGTPSLQLHTRELWNMYAIVLTRLAHCFPVTGMTQVVYLLEEDESTVGFPPLQDPHLSLECNLHTDSYGKLKPRTTDRGMERQHPNIEMESRILDILLCALSLQRDSKIPITLVNDGDLLPVFQYNEHGLPLSNATPRSIEVSSPPMATPRSLEISSPPMAAPSHSAANFAIQEPIDPRTPTQPNNIYSSPELSHYNPDNKLNEIVEPSESFNSMDDNMEQMVDDLVSPSDTDQDETSYGMHSNTAHEVFAPFGSRGMERLHSTPKMLPSIHGLYNSAFTPKPNELQPTSPRRLHNTGPISPLAFSTGDDRMAAAVALDETCYGGMNGRSWGRRSSQPSSTNPPPVNHLIQSAHSQQFSDFSNPSSIYNNTTQIRYGGANAMSPNGNSTFYPGASDFDQAAMLRSSIWNGSRPASYSAGGYPQTPPGGQGG